MLIIMTAGMARSMLRLGKMPSECDKYGKTIGVVAGSIKPSIRVCIQDDGFTAARLQ